MHHHAGLPTTYNQPISHEHHKQHTMYCEMDGYGCKLQTYMYSALCKLRGGVKRGAHFVRWGGWRESDFLGDAEDLVWPWVSSTLFRFGLWFPLPFADESFRSTNIEGTRAKENPCVRLSVYAFVWAVVTKRYVGRCLTIFVWNWLREAPQVATSFITIWHKHYVTNT